METTPILTRLQSRKAALGESRLQQDPLPVCAPGEALTTNNITYLTFGEAPLHYWSFFPTGDAAWAQLPAWGFATVIESRVPGIAPGTRFYGYFPLASHLLVQPERIGARGFFDGAEHRRALTSAYNQYSRCSGDPVWPPDLEHFQALLRPLFVTSYMLADYLADQDFFSAKRLLISSASSKTAYGTAWCLRGRTDLELIALTSAANRDYVRSLGCYSQVLSYEEVDAVPTDTSTVYVDFSGDARLRRRVHEHLGSQLAHDCLVGFAQTSEMRVDSDLPGPRPKFFFAPEQIRKRTADWGPEGFNQRFNDAQQAFFDHLSGAGRHFITLVEHTGFVAAQALVADLVAGRMDPRAGHVVNLPFASTDELASISDRSAAEGAS